MMIKTIAVTGGIGSGKSAVCSYLQSKGVPVYNCDLRTKQLYDEDSSLLSSIEAALDCRLEGEDGRLDKKKLAGIIFNDKEKLARLEQIVHPYVLSDFIAWRENVAKDIVHTDFSKRPFVVLESAIILEKPVFNQIYNAVVLVESPEYQRIQRCIKRDGADISEIRARISLQKFDLKKVDVVINNDSDMATLRSRTDIAFKILSL